MEDFLKVLNGQNHRSNSIYSDESFNDTLGKEEQTKQLEPISVEKSQQIKENILKNCLETLCNESFVEMNSFTNIIIKKLHKDYIPNELKMFDQVKPKDKYIMSNTNEDREIIEERQVFLSLDEKFLNFENIREFYEYGWFFQSEKKIKYLIYNFPKDSDVWFELFLYYQKKEQKQLARQALIVSFQLNFLQNNFLYENSKSFTKNLGMYYYQLTLIKTSKKNE